MRIIRAIRFKAGQKGFTLLEVLVAMIVLAVGILGLAPMVVISMQGNQFSREATEAAYIAQDRMEQLKNQSSITPIPFTETTTAIKGIYTRHVDVSDNTSDNTVPPGVYRLSITVGWTDKQGKSHSNTYMTYKAI